MRRIAWLLAALLAFPAAAQVDLEQYSDESEESSDDSGTEVVDEEGWHLYVGADVATAKLSNSAAPGVPNVSSDLYRLRVGTRLGGVVGLEAQFGQSQDDGANGAPDTYYGLFVVPTATLFETVELSFPMGYASSSLDCNAACPGGIDDSLDSIAYGVNLELPLRVFFDSLPDIRIGGGGMVYYQRSNGRIYGYQAGARWDFNL